MHVGLDGWAGRARRTSVRCHRTAGHAGRGDADGGLWRLASARPARDRLKTERLLLRAAALRGRAARVPVPARARAHLPHGEACGHRHREPDGGAARDRARAAHARDRSRREALGAQVRGHQHRGRREPERYAQLRIVRVGQPRNVALRPRELRGDGMATAEQKDLLRHAHAPTLVSPI